LIVIRYPVSLATLKKKQKGGVKTKETEIASFTFSRGGRGMGINLRVLIESGVKNTVNLCPLKQTFP
jgi:hypothetical protein